MKENFYKNLCKISSVYKLRTKVEKLYRCQINNILRQKVLIKYFFVKRATEIHKSIIQRFYILDKKHKSEKKYTEEKKLSHITLT